MLVRTKRGLTTYQHNQISASSTWSINHALGSKPTIDVMMEIDGVVEKVFPASVTHVDNNNVTITWSSPRTGYAVLSVVKP